MRSEPVPIVMVEVCCDQCDTHGIDIYDEGELGGVFDADYFDNELREAGWRVDESGDTCPFCITYETLFLSHLDDEPDEPDAPPTAQPDLFKIEAAE